VSIESVNRCNEPECINDALARLNKELRNGERVWLIEQNQDGEWSCSVVEENSNYIANQASGHEPSFYNRGFGRGNNVYQAITSCRINLQSTHMKRAK
jgi:hypothetical protein